MTTSKSLLYLWEERTLFIGKLAEPLSLSQGSATLTLSLEGPILVESHDKKISFEGTCVLLEPGCKVNIDTRNQLIANCNLDVMGQDFNALSSRSYNQGKGIYSDFKNEVEFNDYLTHIHKKSQPANETKIAISHLFETYALNDFNLDSRVSNVVDQIKESIDTNLSIESLAQSVNLSVPGLTKLFKKQTGVPIRRYRQWHRLFVTAVEISKGKNLTDAAIDAGFTDLSHCTHTFNMMLGMKPSYFLSRPKDIIVMTSHNQPLCCISS